MLMRVAAAALALGCALLATVPAAAVASGIEVRTVRFAKGESSATTKGSIKGDRTIDYKLRAKAGQTMSVSLKTTNGANYFNVLPPGSSDVANLPDCVPRPGRRFGWSWQAFSLAIRAHGASTSRADPPGCRFRSARPVIRRFVQGRFRFSDSAPGPISVQCRSRVG